jgi:tetratricopeptide (TPR) repeat protein
MRTITLLAVACGSFVCSDRAYSQNSDADYKRCTEDVAAREDSRIIACSNVAADKRLPQDIRANALFWRGVIYVTKSKHELALADHNEAIRLEPNNAEFYSGRADAYLSMNDNDRALRDMSRAISLGGTVRRYYIRRADLLEYLGKKAEALKDLQHALTLPHNGRSVTDSDGAIRSAISRVGG